MTTPQPPEYTGTDADTEGVSGNTGAAPSGTQSTAGNVDTTGPAGAVYGGGPTGLTPDPNLAISATPDTSSAGTSSNTPANFVQTSTALTGTIDTLPVGWPQTPGVTQAFRAPNTTIGYLDGTGARDTTWTDRPVSSGSGNIPIDTQTYYTGTVDSSTIGAPTGPLGTAVPAAPSAPTATAGPHSITVSWTPVADPANAPVHGYVIMSSTGGTVFAARNATSVVVQNVVPDVPYSFTVAARNDVGIGRFSSASATVSAYNPEEADHGKPGGYWPANTGNPIYNPNGTIKTGTGLSGIPGAPTGVTLTAGSAGILNVAWTAPATGGKLTSYTVTLSSGQTQTLLPLTPTTAQFTGLTTGTATTATVTAVGPLGSTASAPSSSVNVP